MENEWHTLNNIEEASNLLREYETIFRKPVNGCF